MTALIELKNVEGFYRDRQVLFGIDLSVETGGTVAVLGANGAGKTTTLRAICGMVRTRGEILFDSQPVSGHRTDQIVRRGIGHVPNGRGTFLNLSVEENLQLGAYLRRSERNLADEFERVYGYFPRLKERRRQQAGTLSGGEQQMLAISRALMLRPRLLLLDEPSFGLAPVIVQEIFEILRTINQQDQTALLIVEQNAALALEIATQAYLIETGRVVMRGSATEFMNNDSVRQAYLGY